MVEINCHIFIKRKIKFFIQILFVFTYFISIDTLYKISSHNIYNNIYITQNRILTESHNNKNKSLRTSYINEYTTVGETEYDNDIDDVETNCQLQDNVSTANDNLETLLEEYHEEMKEIKETNKKSFFKRGLFLIDCLDNIFIDKLVDQNIKNKTSAIVEHVIALSVFLFPCCAIFSQIPIHTYIIKRFDYLERY